MTGTALKFTYQDYRALPAGGPRFQLLDGDLIVSPSPSLRHQRILRRLLRALSDHVESGGLGEVLCAPLDVVLSKFDTPQPDLLFVAADHLHRLAPEGVQGPPDLIVEILSSDRNVDLNVKRKLYTKSGVIEYWIVDPDDNRVDIYRLQDRPDRPSATFRAGDFLESPTFPGFRIPLDAILAP